MDYLKRLVCLVGFLMAASAIAAFLAMLTIVFVGPLLLPREPEPVPIPFDSEIWKAADFGSGGDRRRAMVRDLLQRHPLVGQSRLEIEGLLGSAMDEHTPPGAGWTESYYWLRFSISCFEDEWLVLTYRNGRVESVRGGGTSAAKK